MESCNGHKTRERLKEILWAVFPSILPISMIDYMTQTQDEFVYIIDEREEIIKGIIKCATVLMEMNDGKEKVNEEDLQVIGETLQKKADKLRTLMVEKMNKLKEKNERHEDETCTRCCKNSPS